MEVVSISKTPNYSRLSAPTYSDVLVQPLARRQVPSLSNAAASSPRTAELFRAERQARQSPLLRLKFAFAYVYPFTVFRRAHWRQIRSDRPGPDGVLTRLLPDWSGRGRVKSDSWTTQSV
jgi:hypothetical protein